MLPLLAVAFIGIVSIGAGVPLLHRNMSSNTGEKTADGQPQQQNDKFKLPHDVTGTFGMLYELCDAMKDDYVGFVKRNIIRQELMPLIAHLVAGNPEDFQAELLVKEFAGLRFPIHNPMISINFPGVTLSDTTFVAAPSQQTTGSSGSSINDDQSSANEITGDDVNDADIVAGDTEYVYVVHEGVKILQLRNDDEMVAGEIRMQFFYNEMNAYFSAWYSNNILEVTTSTSDSITLSATIRSLLLVDKKLVAFIDRSFYNTSIAETKMETIVYTFSTLNQ